MKLWGFGKHNKGETNGRIETAEPEQSIGSKGILSESDYEFLWILVCVTFAQMLPRTDLYLCVNERGDVALMALPDPMVSMTWGKIYNKYPRLGVVLIQQIQRGKDKSYLAPVAYTNKQASGFSEITSYFNRGELSQGLKRHNWPKVISEVRADNLNYLKDASYHQRINRIKISDNENPREADDFATPRGYNTEVPVFLYTGADTEREITREQLHREMLVRQHFSKMNINYLIGALETTPGWEHLNKNDVLFGVINKVETELKLLRSPFADIMRNPEKSEVVPGPPPCLRFTPAAVEAVKEAESHGELRFSVMNWKEPDAAHVALHLVQVNGQSMKDSLTSPAITIFRDGMGIHTLQSWLFRIRAASLSLSMQTGKPVNLDTITALEIPELIWKPISEEGTFYWWQTDTIAKKVLWLTTRNLASHLIGDSEEVICSVTPIGNDVVQVALLFDNLEEGAPYAFAIIKDDLAIRAIPVFPKGTYETKPDGTLVTKRTVFLKNYIITREGERVQSGERILQFTKPIFTTVVSAEYREPKVYETGKQAI